LTVNRASRVNGCFEGGCLPSDQWLFQAFDNTDFANSPVTKRLERRAITLAVMRFDGGVKAWKNA
jgi:hypothetical protein